MATLTLVCPTLYFSSVHMEWPKHNRIKFIDQNIARLPDYPIHMHLSFCWSVLSPVKCFGVLWARWILSQVGL